MRTPLISALILAVASGLCATAYAKERDAAPTTSRALVRDFKAYLSHGWVIIEDRDVVASERAAQLFCADGSWHLQGQRQSSIGTYTLRGSELCTKARSGWTSCLEVKAREADAFIASPRGRPQQTAVIRSASQVPEANQWGLAPLCQTKEGHQ